MSKAVFQDILADVKQAIESGEYPYQSYLPSENELRARYLCSRTTVRRALAALAAQGYVQPQQGKGVRVIRDISAKPPRGMKGIETFGEVAARCGFDPLTRVNAFERVTADPALSDTTGFPLGSDLTRIKRVRYADGSCVSSDDSYYLSDSVGDITPAIAEDSVYRYLEETLGVKIGAGTRDITIERPTEEDLRWLTVGDFNAVAVVRGKTYRVDGTLMEYTESRQAPSFFALHETVFRSQVPCA